MNRKLITYQLSCVYTRCLLKPRVRENCLMIFHGSTDILAHSVRFISPRLVISMSISMLNILLSPQCSTLSRLASLLHFHLRKSPSYQMRIQRVSHVRTKIGFQLINMFLNTEIYRAWKRTDKLSKTGIGIGHLITFRRQAPPSSPAITASAATVPSTVLP